MRAQHGDVLAHPASVVEEEIYLPVVVQQVCAFFRNLLAREVVRFEPARGIKLARVALEYVVFKLVDERIAAANCKIISFHMNMLLTQHWMGGAWSWAGCGARLDVMTGRGSRKRK